MTDYRCYLLDGQGTIRAVEEFCSPDDGAALARAREMLDRHSHLYGLELWQRQRRVHLEINTRRRDRVAESRPAGVDRSPAGL